MMLKNAVLFLLFAVTLLLSEAFITHHTAFVSSAHSRTKRPSLLILQSSSSSSSNHTAAEESISQLIREYRELQDKLRGDLLENRQFEVSYDAEALLDKEVQIVELERDQQEERAAAAQKEMNRAIEGIKQAQKLAEEAREETRWAINEAAWLESSTMGGSDYAELEALLLAHAAHDLKETNDILADEQEKRQAALQKEIQVQHLLWFLVQKEENLKQLQASSSHNTKELVEWAKHELPKHESMIKVLRKKLIDRDPTKGDVAF